jgi:hypothetical protein
MREFLGLTTVFRVSEARDPGHTAATIRAEREDVYWSGLSVDDAVVLWL